MAKVTDSRIGVIGANGGVEKYPTHYVNGVFWNKAANSAPTTTYFGKDNKYFYVLPILMPAARENILDELYELIDEKRPDPEVRLKVGKNTLSIKDEGTDVEIVKPAKKAKVEEKAETESEKSE